MRTSALFLISCLVLSAYAGHVDNIFAEINNDEFGRTIVQTIQLQLESGSVVDEVVDAVAGVRQNLLDQQADGDAEYAATSGVCDGDIAELSAGVSGASANQVKFQGLIDLDGPTLAARLQEQSNKQQELADRSALKQSYTDAREAEAAVFASIVEEHRSVGELLEEARYII